MSVSRRVGHPTYGRRWATHDACVAFVNGKTFRAPRSIWGTGKKGGTFVEVSRHGVVSMFLHGSCIAVWDRRPGRESFETTLAGHGTPTTRERLNGLLEAMYAAGYLEIKNFYHQHKGEQCLSWTIIEDTDSWQSHQLSAKGRRGAAPVAGEGGEKHEDRCCSA